VTTKLKYFALVLFGGSVLFNLYYTFILPAKYTLAPHTLVRTDVCEWPIPSNMKMRASYSYDSHSFTNISEPIEVRKFLYFKKMDEERFIAEMNQPSNGHTYNTKLMSEGPGYTLYKRNVLFMGKERLDFVFLKNGQAVTFIRFTEKEVLAMYDHCQATLLVKEPLPKWWGEFKS